MTFLISRKGLSIEVPTAPTAALALGSGPLLSATLSFLSSRAYPDFLLHSSHQCHLCGSPQREPHAVVRSRNSRQEIRGSRGTCGAPEPKTKAPTSEFADLAQTFTRDEKPLDRASIGTDTRSGELRTASLPSNNGLGNACELTRIGFCFWVQAHRRSLGFPGFPVESCGFEQLHVVLFEENHISGTGESCEVGNPGTLGMTERRGSLRGEDRCQGPGQSSGS